MSTTDIAKKSTPVTIASPIFERGYAFYIVFLLGIVGIFNAMDRVALSMLAPAIKADMHFTDAQLGLLVGLAFSLFYAVCGIPIARLADRGNRRNIIAAALAVWSLMTALTGAATNFWHLLLARIGVAAGESGALAPSASIISDCAPVERRALLFSFHAFGIAAGTAVGVILMGRLNDAIGWRWTFVALGLPGMAFALVLLFTLKEPVRGAFDGGRHAEPQPSLLGVVRALWRCDTYKRIILFNVIIGFVVTAQGQWWPSFFSRIHGWSASEIGLYFGIAGAIGSPIGLLGGGFLANTVARRHAKLPLSLSALFIFLALFTTAAALLAPSPLMSMAFLTVTGVFTSAIAPPTIAAVYSVVRANMRATAGTIAGLFTAALGTGIGAFVLGWLSDVLAARFGDQSLRYAMLAPLPLVAVAAGALWFAAQSLTKDLAIATGAGADPVDDR